MKNSINIILIVLLVFITSQSFRCNNKSLDCSNYFTDTSYLKVNLGNSYATLKSTDTIWLQSTISDTLYNRQSSDKIVSPISQLLLEVFPYRIVQVDSVPNISYAGSDFNLVLKDGTSLNGSISSENFLYNRVEPHNTLKVGFVPKKIGLYLFSFRHSIYQGYYRLDIVSSSDVCKQFNAQSYISPEQQNAQYWDGLDVSSLNLQNSEYPLVYKQDHNYFFVKVIK